MKGVGDILIDNGNRGSDSYLLFTATLSNAIFKIALSYSNLMNASPSILNSNTFTIKDKKKIHLLIAIPVTTTNILSLSRSLSSRSVFD